MHIDQHRERLCERLSLLATLVESAFVTTMASAAERSFLEGGRLAIIHDEIASLALAIHAEAVEFLVRFRPVATDLQFATTTLACCADLQVAAVAIEGFAGLMGRVDPSTFSESVPSIDRMASCVHTVVSLAADAIAERDGSAYEAVRELHADAAAVRELVRHEVTVAVIRPQAAIDRLIEVDAAGCMLERIAAVAAACVRRLARAGIVERGLPLETA